MDVATDERPRRRLAPLLALHAGRPNSRAAKQPAAGCWRRQQRRQGLQAGAGEVPTGAPLYVRTEHRAALRSIVGSMGGVLSVAALLAAADQTRPDPPRQLCWVCMYRVYMYRHPYYATNPARPAPRATDKAPEVAARF